MLITCVLCVCYLSNTCRIKNLTSMLIGSVCRFVLLLAKSSIFASMLVVSFVCLLLAKSSIRLVCLFVCLFVT